MKNILIINLVILLGIAGCVGNYDLSQVQWTPTMEDVINDDIDIKLLVFFREDPTCLGTGKGIGRFNEIGRITEPNKIEKVMESIEEDSTICPYEDQCAHMFMWPTWMGVINRSKQGLLINLGWDHSRERVEWMGHYSERLYELLIEYGIIKPLEKSMFVNDPNVIRFKAPPQNQLQPKKPRVITTFFERDLDQIYIKIDPNETPVYVQVDSNTPGVYIAVDSNVVVECVKQLASAINMMSDQSAELMAQNRWLKDTLDKCLKKLEAEKGFQPIATDSEDYVKRFKLHRPEDVPYTKPQTKPLLKETPDINKVRALMNLHCLATSMYVNLIRENIKDFEQRMKRLESCSER